MIHLVIGDNTALIEETISELIESSDEIPYKKLMNSSLEDWQNAIESCDMFTPRTGIICYQPKWLKASKDECKKIETILNLSSQFDMPLIIVAKTVDKRLSCYKLLKKKTLTEHACQEFKEWEIDKVKNWIHSYCRKNNSSITNDACELLLNSYGTQLNIIKQELIKCMVTIAPLTEITAPVIESCSGSATGHYYTLSNEIKAGNVQGIITSVQSLIHLKEDAHKIFNQILFQLNQLLPIALGLKEKKSSDEIARELGKHPFFIKKQVEGIMRNPLARKLRKIFPVLALIDREIKSGKLTGKQGLIRLTTTLKYQI